MNETMILKIKRPAATPLPDAKALIYNQDMSFVCMKRITKVLGFVLSAEETVFWHCEVDRRTSSVHLLRPAEPQAW